MVLSTAIPTLIAAIVMVIMSNGIPIQPMNPNTTPIERTFGKIAISAIVNERNRNTNIIRNEIMTTPKVKICDLKRLWSILL